MTTATAWRPRGSPIRVGLVGLGNVGIGHHLPAFEEMPELAVVVAVADPVAERRALAAERLGLGPEGCFATPEALLDAADVDVVDLATPPASRTALALRAVAAGRAVICEKPLALAPADGERLAAAAADAGIPVAVVHNWLHLPEVLSARAAIEAGTIGRPEVAIVNALGVEDRPGSGAWRPAWRHEPTIAGGGVLMDMLHLVYIAEAFLGSPFRRVSAEVLVRAPGAAVEDAALCRFESDDAIALVNVGWGLGPGGMTIAGPDGRIEIAYADGGTGPFASLSAVRVVRRDGGVVDRTPADLPPPGVIDVRVSASLRSVFIALRDGDAMPTDIADGVRALEATLGAYVSAATGRTVALPLPTDHPVHERGIAGIADLQLDPGAVIARHGVFGVGGASPSAARP